ncbi:MAG: FAD-dependent oxidoreductase [Alphaproteobacteria bacterium]|nr:FAD-dependent oxidoreductase [Alphaproteobacteria bacterium]
MRYDVAIIGAGADGLAAAALLARAGRRVVLLERAPQAGGRCVTSEFVPGFLVSPYADTVPSPPAPLLPLLGLTHLLEDFAPVGADIMRRRGRALARVLEAALAPAPQSLWQRLKATLFVQDERPWPGADWADQSIAALRAHAGQNDWRTALAGRAIDPELNGSAMALFAAPQSRVRRGGVGAAGAALQAAALKAGAELRLEAEVAEILLLRSGAGGVLLADGTRLEAEAVISTLDFKRTFLALFRWSDLPPGVLRAAGAWRMSQGRARLLLALAAPPGFSKPIFVSAGEEALSQFRHGVPPSAPAMLVDPVSARDPSLAPDGGAVVTLTLSGIPPRLFDGDWTQEKRETLLARALERLAPLKLPRLVGAATVLPADVEQALGLSGGDLDGGELAPDQMLSFRPGARTAVPGLYLAGPSSAAGPLGLGVAGLTAALALMADLSARSGR